jgi:hypothetical protein
MIQSEYKKNNTSHTIKRVLVVGINDNQDAAAAFESKLVEQLQSEEVVALAANTALKNNEVSEANIIDVVLKQQIDSVIVTRLVATQKESVTTQKKTELIFEQPRPESLTEAFVINYKHVALESYTDTTATVLLSSDLYSTSKRDENREWGIQFVVAEKNSREEILDNAVQIIAKKLSADGLIK